MTEEIADLVHLRRTRDLIDRGYKHPLGVPNNGPEPLGGRTLRKEARLMKAMTCKQLGGPCDFLLHGNTADEVIKAQDRHLKEMVAGGDETHKSASKAMKGRWKNPLSGMAWYRKTKRDFAALPED